MAKLFLIKHSSPTVDAGSPASSWQLSPQGKQRCAALAGRLHIHGLTAVVTSQEPKAVQTGQLLADALGIPCGSAPGLHEHDRDNVPLMPTSHFISTMAQFFRRPGELVLGRETAGAALVRFENALNAVVASHPDQNLAVVTHGTVLSLFAAAHSDQDAYTLWRRMSLPSYLVFELPGWVLKEIVATVQC